jgi:hypothetical protein
MEQNGLGMDQPASESDQHASIAAMQPATDPMYVGDLHLFQHMVAHLLRVAGYA